MAAAAGPAAGLELLAPLDAPLERYHLLHAVRADLLRRAGRPAEALAAYRRARDLTSSPAERALLERRMSEVARA